MKRYEDYAPTGVEWMPEIPAGWEVKKLKHCFKFTVGGTPTTSKASYFEGDNTWVTIADMHERVIVDSKTCISDEGIVAASMEIVPEGSLMYSFKLSVGKVAFAGKDLYTNEAIFSVLPGPGYDLTYFYFALPELLVHSAGRNIYGAKIFNQELLKNAFIALPPLSQQRAIARFLDDKTAQIDQLITQKQQMLALLQEERAALINRAVTRGLDSDAPVRASGIEWLGDVPEHWEVKRLKYFCQINPAKGNAELGLDEVVTFLPMERVSEEGEVDTSLSKTFQEVQTGYTYFEERDTLVAKITPCFENGKGAFLKSLPTQVGFGSTEFHVLRASGKILGEFLYLLTKTDMFTKMGEASMVGSAGQKRVPTSFIENFPVAAPPNNEQKEILAELSNRAQKYAETFSTIKQETTLLQEYRAALIAEAVTGQIDVRNYESAPSLTAEFVG